MSLSTSALWDTIGVWLMAEVRRYIFYHAIFIIHNGRKDTSSPLINMSTMVGVNSSDHINRYSSGISHVQTFSHMPKEKKKKRIISPQTAANLNGSLQHKILKCSFLTRLETRSQILCICFAVFLK